MTTAKRMTKAQIVGELSDKTGLTKKEVGAVFDGLRDMIKRELGKRGPGEFVIPDMLKLKVKQVPARPAGKRVDPFTKEEREFPAKPASKKVRATPLKKLKDLVN